MTLLDTNIFIYLANGTLSRQLIAKTDIAYSDITKIEALGYSTIQANELLLLEALFNEAYSLNLNQPVIDRAVKLRQARQMSLGDSIIAATALEHNLLLWTANANDYKHIEGLKLANPINP